MEWTVKKSFNLMVSLLKSLHIFRLHLISFTTYLFNNSILHFFFIFAIAYGKLSDASDLIVLNRLHEMVTPCPWSISCSNHGCSIVPLWTARKYINWSCPCKWNSWCNVLLYHPPFIFFTRMTYQTVGIIWLVVVSVIRPTYLLFHVTWLKAG